MVKRMLVDATHPEETRVVVVSGNRLEEFDFETASKKQLKGNIYLAKVTRVEPSLQAAFVDYGGNRHGFLAFSEIHPDYYRIPVSDRDALMAETARLAERRRRGRRGRRRRRDPGRRKPGRRRDRRHRPAPQGHLAQLQDPGSHLAPADPPGPGDQGGARQQGCGAHHLHLARRALCRADAQHAARRRHLAQDHQHDRPAPPQVDPGRSRASPKAWRSSCAPPAWSGRRPRSSATTNI